MTTLPARESPDVGRLLTLIAAAVLVVVLALLLIEGDGTIAVRSGDGMGPATPPVAAEVPAHIQEAIVFGEIDAVDITPSAEILPPHVVEQGYFEQ